MNLVKNLSKNLEKLGGLKSFELILCIVLVLYLISDVSTPYELTKYVNNTYMYLSFFMIVILIYLYSNPLIAILFAITAFVFINKSKYSDPTVVNSSKKNKEKVMKTLNKHLETKTLEEEIVGQIVKRPLNIAGPSDYHPIMCQTYNAEQI